MNRGSWRSELIATGLVLLVFLMVGVLLGTSTARHLRQRASDAWVVARIEVKYLEAEGANTRQVHVTARQGVVTLCGTVPDERIRRQAIALAKGTGSVTGVVDLLSLDDEARIARTTR